MSVLDDRDEFLKNPLAEEREFGDFTAFYIAITICSVLGGFLFILNIVFCWCSKYKDYWQDSDTGNRWILSIWTRTPCKQTPLDYSELEKGYTAPDRQYSPIEERGFVELQKRESDL